MTRPRQFHYDVLLSHSSKDKAVVRPLAERLRADGLKVWFDEWVLKPGDSIPAKIEQGLEHSRVLVLCMSAQAFGSDCAQLEAGTFRFREPVEPGAPLHSPAARRRPHQRLPGAVPLCRLDLSRPRAGISETGRSLSFVRNGNDHENAGCAQTWS